MAVRLPFLLSVRFALFWSLVETAFLARAIYTHRPLYAAVDAFGLAVWLVNLRLAAQS